ncbi:MAG TPA: hypothetical protein VK907_14845 [Phnomibacter sp.]|nr:hypothetical protein [Phnomibacter sp.]
MRSIILFVSVCLTLQLHATVHTVSNNPINIAQFNTIQAAVDAAVNGDTILVHGSPNNYTAFTITNKRLAIIGPGYSPDKNLSLRATVPGFTVTGAGSSGCEFQGLYVTSTVTINSNKPDNITFRRNWFETMSFSINQSSITYTGYLFESNYFQQSQLNGTSSTTYNEFIFRNNLFYDNGGTFHFNSFTNTNGFVLDHNVFYAGAGATVRNIFVNNCRFFSIRNNIFVKRNAANALSNSEFSNNITFNSENNTPWASNGNTDVGGNVANQNPQMVAQTAVDAGTIDPLLNFSIVAGPAKGGGTDGRDMGLRYDPSGPLNWANGRNSRLPRIYSMNLASIDIQAGGNINVQIEARRSN